MKYQVKSVDTEAMELVIDIRYGRERVAVEERRIPMAGLLADEVPEGDLIAFADRLFREGMRAWILELAHTSKSHVTGLFPKEDHDG